MRCNCNAGAIQVKTATFPSLRVDPELRSAAEEVLEAGESLSSFVEQSIRDGVQRRQAQREFVARGLKSRDAARKAQSYVPASKVVVRLEGMLARAKRAAAKK
jgi:predicted transcriptional regulator